MFRVLLIILIKISVINNIATIEGEGIITNQLIAQYANEKYTKIIINNGATSAAKDAFRNCEALETIVIPNSLTNLPGNSFFRCKNLRYFLVNDDHTTLSTDWQNALYDKLKKKLIHASDIDGFVIPNTVTCIDENAFNGNSKLSSICIPNSVSQILACAFNEVLGFKSITFEPNSSLTEIVQQSFWYSNFSEVHIPPSIIKIHDNSFYNSKIQRLIFDDIENSKLVSIGVSSFAKFLGTDIKLPPSVQTISQYCFQDSPNLETINIPRDCSFINFESFSSCTNLNYISIDDGNQYFEYKDGILVDKEYTTIYSTYVGAPEVIIKKGITNIAAGALQSRKTIKKLIVRDNDLFSTDDLILYDKDKKKVHAVVGGAINVQVAGTVESILDNAFSLSDVTNVTFLSDNTLQTIGMNSFLNCKKLTTINLPNSIKDIGNSAFDGCDLLTEYVLDENAPITEVKQWSLQNTGITRVVLSKNVQKLGYFSLHNCVNLRSIVIPSGNLLTKIESGACRGCINLISIETLSNLNYITEFAFKGCTKLSLDFRNLVNLETIGTNVFGGCAFTELFIPSNVVGIYNQAFAGNSQLTTVTFDQNSQLTSISPSLFSNCTSLNSISLPPSVTKIDPSVFSGCFSLTDISITGTNFKIVEKILYTYNGEELVLCPPGLESANVTTGVKILGNDGFNGCKLLKNITFKQPSDVNSTNANTFTGCTNLSSIEMPDSVIEINDNSFGGCTLLSSVIFSNQSILSKIGNLVFSDCISLKTIMLPPKLQSLGTGAFKGCSSLEHIPISGSSLHGIPSECFMNSGVVSFEVPESVSSIGRSAFSGCPLASIRIPSGVESIEESAFGGCHGLTTVLFCGDRNVGGDTVFPNATTIYVRREYEGSVFCGRGVVRALDAHCNIIPPSPTPSRLFTSPQLDPASSLLIASVGLICDTGADVE